MPTFLNRTHYTPSNRAISSRMLHRNEAEGITSSSRDNNDTLSPMKRLVVRDLPYHQSSNSLRVRHQMSPKHSKKYTRSLPLRFFFWYIEDWFHVFLRFRTIISGFFIVVIWTCFLLIFAAVYMYVDAEYPKENCGLGRVGKPISFHGAFAFALETATTVGFGLPNGTNGFFLNCPHLQITIYFQMMFSMFFNAFLVSFIFARLSRCEARAAQVLFSDKAVLNREILPNGIARYMLSTRIYDADSMFPIVEAHVRFYAVKHRNMHGMECRDVRFPICMEPMRVSKPNDDWGELLYTSVPACVSHHIDYYSPISPPSKKLGPEDGRLKSDSGFVMHPCGLTLRENDSYTGGQDGLRCVICGETYGTVLNLEQHIRYQQLVEKHDDIPVSGTHQELDVDAIFKKKRETTNNHANGNRSNNSTGSDRRIDIDTTPTPPWYDEYRNYLIESNIEIICVMEAIDPIMSGTFQAIQSYTIDDIVFDAEFAPCVISDHRSMHKEGHTVYSRMINCLRRMFVGRSAVGRSIKIDLDSFHSTVNIGEGCSER